MKTLCPNCEKETECNMPIEVYTCSECNEDFADYENPQITRLTARIKELEDANRWIPVSERNPKDADLYPVLIINGNPKYKKQATAFYSTVTGWDRFVVVTHWRETLPLPMLPEVEE